MRDNREGRATGGGLEEVFRSHEFGRTSVTASRGAEGVGARTVTSAIDPGAWSGPYSSEQRPHAETPVPTGGQPLGTSGPSLPTDAVPATGAGGAGLAASGGAIASGAPWRGPSYRYWTMAAVSALVALVVAGVTSGVGQHSTTPITAGQGPLGQAQPRGHTHTSRPATTGPNAPGSLTGNLAGAALALRAPSGVTHGAGLTATVGRVTLGGAASTTGSAGSGPPLPSGGSGGGGAPGLPSGSGGPDPLIPVTATVGSSADAVGSTVSSITSELSSELPAVAPAATAVDGAVSGAVSAVDDAVDATTF
jgi:hypothetical protein